MSPLLILNYHRIISDKETVSKHFRNFTIDRQEFERQLTWIKNKRINVIDLADLNFTDPHQFNLALTFDDGKKSDMDIVLPLLKKFEYKATFFPVINLLGTEDCLNWNELKYISKSGFSIGSHSLTHSKLTNLSSEELKIELTESKKILEEKLGKPVIQFSIPYGIYNKKVLRTIKETGYQHTYSTQFKINPFENRFLMYRWNIRRSTSYKVFQKIINQNIAANLFMRVSGTLKHLTHQLFF